ncbi:MAG: FAD-binding protein [Pseudobutyrivibrio ruminis]|nr:FAD-binding protein [Pseudobutyrivibrio ruminis]
MSELNKPRTLELRRPDAVSSPYESEYNTDVVVVGAGFAGLNAAAAAKEKGVDVLVIDKGKPGYSGLSPWPSSFRWFDPDRDNADAFRAAMMRGGDYISNLHWYDMWINESKSVYERLTKWGILSQYPGAREAGDYFEREDFVGYRETFDNFDRHKKWIKVLNDYEIPYLEHTMVVDVIVENNKLSGVMAFHVPSGQIIRINAKSVVLATGGGSYKPTGYPVGSDTFDGEYIAYNLGLPIAGKEFEDFHNTSSQGPGNVFLDNHWQYLENIWLCGGDVTNENKNKYADNKGNIMVMGRVKKAVYGINSGDGSEIQDVAGADFTRRGASRCYEEDPDEVRSGKKSTPVAASVLAGAATGMCCHLTSGVFCGMYDSEGKTEIAGLYVAGDGIHATAPSGAAYPCGVGFTSCFTSIDGYHAGGAAGEFSKGVKLSKASDDYIEKMTKEILEPTTRDKGFDANWARDVLHSIMAPYWVSTVKSEATLEAALTQVKYMSEHVIPNLCAPTSHDLRLCIEMKHKVLSAQLKLSAALFRKESRGNTYREDYPYRDDSNFLCYVVIKKDSNGQMQIEKEPIPEEWTGDLNQAYDKRYGYYFPKEPQAKGFTPVEGFKKGGR